LGNDVTAVQSSSRAPGELTKSTQFQFPDGRTAVRQSQWSRSNDQLVHTVNLVGSQGDDLSRTRTWTRDGSGVHMSYEVVQQAATADTGPSGTDIQV
jgi:hypothetical protein